MTIAMEMDNVSPSTSRGAGGVNGAFDESPVHYSVKEVTKTVNDVGTGRVRPKIGVNRKVPKKPQTARDRDRMDAGKQALRELLKERKQKKSNRTSCTSLLRLYITILAALMIIGGLLVLFFLVPMTIDPALATLNYDIDDNPAICLTLSSVQVKKVEQKKNFWCSCSEGCTKDIYVCHQITVAYRKRFLQLPKPLQGNFNHTAYFSKKGWENVNIVDDIEDTRLSSTNANCQNEDWVTNAECWDYLNGSLFANVKGCGYPPDVDCDKFNESFNKTGRRYICHYSRLDPSIVIINYSPNKAWEDLTMSLGWTFGAQAVGAVLIFLLHCPIKASCKSIFTKSQKTK